MRSSHPLPSQASGSFRVSRAGMIALSAFSLYPTVVMELTPGFGVPARRSCVRGFDTRGRTSLHRREFVPALLAQSESTPMVFDGLLAARWWLLTILICTVTTGFATPPSSGAEPGKFWVFVGTYTDGQSKGIYRMEFDPASGKLSEPTLAAELSNPRSWRSTRRGKYLYAVNEGPARKGGGVTAFALDAKTGELTRLNQESTVGDGPCHLVVDATGKNVLVANYGGGSVAVLPIGPDGKLGPASDFVQHKGKVFDPETPGRASCPLDQPRQGEPLRRGRRSWPRPGVCLQVRPDPRQADAQRSPLDQGQGPLRPAPLRVPPRRQARVRDQRNRLHGHRVRLRRRPRHADRDPDDSDDAGRRRAPALDRRGRGPPVGEVPLRLEPRS